jgi:hypothetical protein
MIAWYYKKLCSIGSGTESIQSALRRKGRSVKHYSAGQCRLSKRSKRRLKKIRFILAFTAIAAVALSLRLYRFSPPATLNDYTANPTSQLPPGLHSDEAFNALGGLRILETGQLAAYSSIDEGRSVAHMTATALVITLLGPIAESTRVASLLFGLAAIATIAWLVRALFREILSPTQLLILQIFAAFQVAVTYWFVHFSRTGFELITLPALMLASFAALWHWLHRPSISKSILAGGVLGLTLYSYYAAYAVPVVVGLTLVAWALNRRGRLRWRQVLTYAGAFGIVALPLGLYALAEPATFFHRISDTAAPSVLKALTIGARTVFGLVAVGDTTTAYNLPGRALLDPIQVVLSFIGVVMCLRRIKQPEFLFILLWLVVMLLPAQLSDSAPAFNRLAGAVPAIILLGALGGVQIYQWLARLKWKWVAPLVILSLLAFTTLKTAYDYFEVWPQSKGLLSTFSLNERIQSEVIQSQLTTQQNYISPSDNQRSIFAYLWQERNLAISFNGRRCTVLPRVTTLATTWTLNTLEDKRTKERLSALYPQLVSQPVWVESGTTAVAQLSLPAGLTAQVPTTTIATFGDLFRLRDYRLIDPPTQGGQLRARLLWEPIGPTSDDWVIATYLLDSAGRLRAQEDRQPCDGSYPTSRWQSTDLISDDRVLPIPTDLPAGEYQLAIAVYRLSDNTRLPVRGSLDQPLDDMFFLGTVTVP